MYVLALLNFQKQEMYVTNVGEENVLSIEINIVRMVVIFLPSNHRNELCLLQAIGSCHFVNIVVTCEQLP